MYDLLAAVLIMSLLSFLFSCPKRPEIDPVHIFPADYLLAQTQALAAGENRMLESRMASLPQISFNANGNVSKAMTLLLGSNGKDIIIELGPGKLVFR